jgi:hypothetical protein
MYDNIKFNDFYNFDINYYWFSGERKKQLKIVNVILKYDNGIFKVTYKIKKNNSEKKTTLSCDDDENNDSDVDNNDEIKQLITIDNNIDNFLEEQINKNEYEKYSNGNVVWKKIQILDNWYLYIFDYVYEIY